MCQGIAPAFLGISFSEEEMVSAEVLRIQLISIWTRILPDSFIKQWQAAYIGIQRKPEKSIFKQQFLILDSNVRAVHSLLF
jgi:hypothetical protein